MSVKDTYTVGPFGERPFQTMSVRAHRLSQAESQLEDVLAIFEHLDQRGLCDDLTQLIERVVEQMATEQEEGTAA